MKMENWGKQIINNEKMTLQMTKVTLNDHDWELYIKWGASTTLSIYQAIIIILALKMWLFLFVWLLTHWIRRLLISHCCSSLG